MHGCLSKGTVPSKPFARQFYHFFLYFGHEESIRGGTPGELHTLVVETFREREKQSLKRLISTFSLPTLDLHAYTYIHFFVLSRFISSSALSILSMSKKTETERNNGHTIPRLHNILQSSIAHISIITILEHIHLYMNRLSQNKF